MDGGRRAQIVRTVTMSRMADRYSSSSRVDERWSGLRHALSGLFCASLSSMDSKRTTSPTHTFLPGPLPAIENATYHLRHASLPAENVCTENLTPFVKLLPCTTQSGLGSLLAPHKLFDADWHGMGVHVSWDPVQGVVVRLGVNAVFNPVRTRGDGKRGRSRISLSLSR
jgi:phosphatidylinositol glycan class T